MSSARGCGRRQEEVKPYVASKYPHHKHGSNEPRVLPHLLVRPHRLWVTRSSPIVVLMSESMGAFEDFETAGNLVSSLVIQLYSAAPSARGARAGTHVIASSRMRLARKVAPRGRRGGRGK